MRRGTPRRSAMSTRFAPLLLGALVLAVAAPARAAAPDCASDVAGRVQRRYEKVKDLSAHFEQTTQRVSLGKESSDALVAKGEVLFAKPGKMRWSYTSPEPSLVVSDGSTLWVYDPQAHEVQKLPLGEGYLSAAGVQFLLGEGKLQDEFRVAASGCGEPIVTLGLTPRREAQYERLEMRVDRKSGIVRETTVVDLFGNRTTIAFDELRENTGPAADLFGFTPPAGVRVITLPSAP
jgi:outer membrane lipoprotein carrier protein